MERHTTLTVFVLALGVALRTLAQDAESTTKPGVLVPASSGRANTMIHLSGVDQPTADDVALGALINDQKPGTQIIPKFVVGAIAGKDKNWDVALTVEGLIPFGESTVPLLFKRQPLQILRFRKVGLVAKPPEDTGFAVREGQPLFIVLENPTAFDYPTVRARFRFQDVEVCQAKADKSAGGSSGDNANCDDPIRWATFSIPKYAPVTLRVPAAPQWFLDPQTGFPKAGKRKGVLSLQFVGDGQAAAVYEQTLPLEVQFSPGDSSVFGNLVRVGVWLMLGALVALALRVTIPNYRRKSVLKEQLADLGKATRAISDDVESMLRVLLRVERLNLDQLRRLAWISGPSFQDLAGRIEQGLAILKRKIEYARRLDTAVGRRGILLEQDAPPTRIAAIDKQLDAACESLMRDQLAEQDWVFIQQRLEAADKLVHEPSQEDKDSFQATLVQRWKSIRDFFELKDRKLAVPPALAGMESAFPTEEGLPKETDTDGSQWVAAIGPTRADLQLGALEALRDYLFLAPAVAVDPRWTQAKDQLRSLCATPSTENLTAARLLIRQLEEGVDAADILAALQADEASIDMSPQFVQHNEKARISLRFKDPRLNTAAARLALQCEWTFQTMPGGSPPKADAVAPGSGSPYREHGWAVYHYFEESVSCCEIKVRFYWKGEPVYRQETPAGQEPVVLVCASTVYPQVRAQDWKVWLGDRFERVFPEALQLAAALLVPLAALAVTQNDQGTSGRWWELFGVGFGSETVRNILTGKPEQSGPAPQPPQRT